MATASGVPNYMAQLLDELGWNQGTRIPLASPENQALETVLLNRQNEIQQLKEALQLQKQKSDDLNKYKEYVHSEYQENTRLLFAHKQQMEQEVKLKQLAWNESDRLDHDISDCGKQSKAITERIDRVQSNIARFLKKADNLKSEVCGERGALQEWRAALERNSCDIMAIEQFTKQDTSKAKELETKRQKLKMEHDKMNERLVQLVSNLSAEERACERISGQVIQGLEQRRQMMAMWTAAIENLRQRDTDIRHIREDYAVLEAEANKITEQCREQQEFCDQQRGNNAEAERENMALNQRLGQLRLAYSQLVQINATNDSEAKSLQKELGSMRNTLEKMHMENRHIMEEQHRRDVAIQKLQDKIRDLKEKLAESLDKSKSAEKRAKQLEEMLNEEEHYANGITANQQRAMHCSFNETQKLLALKNEEKLFHMQLKSSKAIMCKLDNKQKSVERSLQSQKETLYQVIYQLETIGARVAHMEGAQAERIFSAELVEKENRLKEVCSRHAARVALLERHSSKLHDDMRRLTRALENASVEHGKLQSRLKTSMLNVEGGDKDLKNSKTEWRRIRVEEALTRLRVAHSSRALAGLDGAAFTLDERRLQLDAAMNERLVEIDARREMFNVQKRALLEDCGKLRSDIRERENRIEQLKKRYDIFIASLGKDEYGQQLSVTFFKIKFAAERAELRERGAALDTDIGRWERDISALEATLRIMHAAHAHFMHHISPLEQDTPEIEELNSLTRQYYDMRDNLKEMIAVVKQLELDVNEISERHTLLNDKFKQLSAREAEAENEAEAARDRVVRQRGRLYNAQDTVRHYARRAKKLIEKGEHWRYFQMALWIRDYSEAAHNALKSLVDICQSSPEVSSEFATAVSATDLQAYLTKQQRRLQVFVQKIVNESLTGLQSSMDADESVFSSSSSSASALSMASGYTKRLAGFRKTLAPKIQEAALGDISSIAKKSSISLKVVTLGLEDSSGVTLQQQGKSQRL